MSSADLVERARRGLGPVLGPLEAARQRRLQQLWWLIPLILAIAFAAAVALWLRDPDGNGWLWIIAPGQPVTIGGALPYFVFGIGVIAAVALVFCTRSRFAGVASALVMPELCRAVGQLDHRRRPSGVDLTSFSAAEVAPSFARAEVEDLFIGEHRGTPFRLAETRLASRGGPRRKRSKRREVFRGLLIDIAVPRPFTGRVLISQSYGTVGNALRRWIGDGEGLEPLALDHAGFGDHYLVRTDDPETARALLVPHVAAAIADLGKAHRGNSQFRAAFAGGRFLLALPLSRNLFEPTSLFRPAAAIEARLPDLLREITAIHRLIDQLHGDPATVAFTEA